MVEILIHVGKARLLTAIPMDDSTPPKPAPIDGPVKFDTLGPPLVAVRQSATSAYIVAPATVDPMAPTFQLVLSADADPTPNTPEGGGIRTITAVLMVRVVNPEAQSLAPTVGDEIDAADVPPEVPEGQAAAAKKPAGKK